jgi:hypothetical protein
LDAASALVSFCLHVAFNLGKVGIEVRAEGVVLLLELRQSIRYWTLMVPIHGRCVRLIRGSLPLCRSALFLFALLRPKFQSADQIVALGDLGAELIQVFLAARDLIIGKRDLLLNLRLELLDPAIKCLPHDGLLTFTLSFDRDLEDYKLFHSEIL